MLKLLGTVLHFLGRVCLFILRGTLKVCKAVAPYIVKGVKQLAVWLEKAMPYILKGLSKAISYTIKLIPRVINWVLAAAPVAWLGLQKISQKIKGGVKNIKEKIKTRRLKKQKEKAQEKTKSETVVKEKSNVFTRAINKIKEVMNKKVIEASATIGALGGTGLAVDALVSSGQYTLPEFAMPAAAAGIGTYVIHKTKQKIAKKREEFENATNKLKNKIKDKQKIKKQEIQKTTKLSGVKER